MFVRFFFILNSMYVSLSSFFRLLARVHLHRRICTDTHSHAQFKFNGFKMMKTNKRTSRTAFNGIVYTVKRQSIESMMNTLGAVLYALFYLISIQFNFLFVCFFLSYFRVCHMRVHDKHTYIHRRKHEGMSDFSI